MNNCGVERRQNLGLSVSHLNKLIGLALAFGFGGHAFVSLGFSPSFRIHSNLLSWFGEAAGFSLPVSLIGFVELAFVLTSLSGFFRKEIRVLGGVYLLLVSIVAGCYFGDISGRFFGVTEVLRRVPWMAMILFLHCDGFRRYALLRFGVVMMFLAHGLASLAVLGSNGMHVELASQLLDAGDAEAVVRIAGYTDLVMAVGLAIPGASRYVAYPACCWIAFVVVLSFGMAFPDGLFRLGFLLCALTLILDPKTHQSWFRS